MTVGCARCHDHFYDPITQRDYYSMKSLFDPLVLRQVDLATPEQVFEQGRRVEEHERRLARAVSEMKAFIRPYFDRLYEEQRFDPARRGASGDSQARVPAERGRTEGLRRLLSGAAHRSPRRSRS